MLLRRLLEDNYDDLKVRLTRRLGSTEAASEVLHETWLRLERLPEPTLLHNPTAYLFRVALNIVKDRWYADRRRLSLAEVEALRQADRTELDPAQIAIARADIELLIEALHELPERCRAIFIAARVEEIPLRDIAGRFGISTRMVQRELHRALVYCRARLEINLS